MIRDKKVNAFFITTRTLVVHMEAFIWTAQINRQTRFTGILLTMFDQIRAEALTLQAYLNDYGDTPSFGREE